MSSTILVTGGAGFIGSHTLVELMAAGFDPVVLDDFSNSRPDVLDRVRQIAGKPVPYVEGDVRDAAGLDALFARQAATGRPVGAVLHFAAAKAVGESVARPLHYYDNNVAGTVTLLQAMQRAQVSCLVFSSSATVYGWPQRLPFDESHPVRAINPYGHTKAMIEQVLQDLCQADPRFTAISLRYFNPIGAHPSGLIGEDPRGIPNNLFPFITQVASGRLAELQVFGDDYDTPDGTGVRDYLHVCDLAAGHVRALEYAGKPDSAGFRAINLGTGQGTSVLEMVRLFENVTGQKVPYRIRERRPGDLDAMWADAELAKTLLGWTAQRDVSEMCRDGWRWQASRQHD
ncbi:UDP-N-acetylglucosamine C4 epimerase [Bordetella ansorpii]|uniref:UDP-glucose 4-epimerase n=1 Tax=Bordetella ansorpii TaxID=288768 RepID=A0A157S9T4_9BORD|nr:UDP-glucose 4-epimerase GalE [Bordetella ansorpii]SAI67124.1 UDP-N-acetylglucosamine C4 epimerase [Bordetella ansorpii]